MGIEFRPLSKTDPDNYDILYNGTAIGTFFWKRNHPRPADKVAVVHSLSGRVAIAHDEKGAVDWLISVAAEEPESVLHKMLFEEKHDAANLHKIAQRL